LFQIELYIKSVFSGRYWLVFLGIYHTNTKENLGRYILVSFFLAGTPFSLKKGALAPFLRVKGGTGHLFDTASPPFAEKTVPAKLHSKTNRNTDCPVKADTGKIPIPKKLLVTP
jgi:hypothetical protein